MTLAIGTKLGPYEILSPLGAGGMGEVYRAKDSRLDREVAIKVLPDQFARDQVALSRFEREAKAVAALSHPNILAVYDVGREGDTSYVVTELLEGQTLRERLRGGSLTWRKAVEIGSSIADGMGAAHARGIVHRDLKPENVFLTKDGVVKILDFGLARMESGPPPAGQDAAHTPTVTIETRPGTIIGTLNYMSPEQLRGKPTDARSDIFSFGCVLYEMVTGHRAFKGETSADTMTAILREAPAGIRSSSADAGVELERVIDRCLEKRPEQRFHSAPDLAFTLRAILADSGPVRATRADRSRWGFGALVATAAIVIAILGAWGITRLWSTSTARSPVAASMVSQIRSIAVLPFESLSERPDQEHFVDMITEAITDDLAKIGALEVIASRTMMGYKGSKLRLPAIADELNVDAFVTGSAVDYGHRVQFRVRLVDAATERQLWSNHYESDKRDILAMQREVARAVAEELKIKLTPAERHVLASAPEVEPAAYDAYARGVELLRRNTRESCQAALTFFDQALEADPSFALAHVGRANAFWTLASTHMHPADTMPQMGAAARKALEMDENLVEAHVALGRYLMQYEWDWKGARESYERALSINQNHSGALIGYGSWLSAMKRGDEAMRQLDIVRERDRSARINNEQYGGISFMARRYERTIRDAREAIKEDPEFFASHEWLGLALAQLGNFDEAIHEMRRAYQITRSLQTKAELGGVLAVAGHREEALAIREELHQHEGAEYVCPYEVATISIGLGDYDVAFEDMHEACDDRAGCIPWLQADPRLDPLRDDARFDTLLRRVGFQPETRPLELALDKPAVQKSLAILPFEIVSSDMTVAYLGDEIPASVIDRLAALSTLRVLPRNSSFRFRQPQQDTASIGRSLRVDVILAGQISSLGERLRVRAQLIDVAENRQIWGDRFDYGHDDLLTMEDEIVEQIASALRIRVTGEEQAGLKRRYTEDGEAYRAYLRGRFWWNKRSDEGFARAIEHFQSAVDRDPQYALALAGLADTHVLRGVYQFASPTDAARAARRAARAALRIEDNLAEAHVSLGGLQLFYDWDWDAAEASFSRAIELKPNYATAHQWFGWADLARGNLNRAIVKIERAHQLDPQSVVIMTDVAMMYRLALRYDEAERLYDEALEIDPSFVSCHRGLGSLYLEMGRFDEAIAALEIGYEKSNRHGFYARALGGAYGLAGRTGKARELLQVFEKRGEREYVSPMTFANIHASLGEMDRAIEYLEDAYMQRDPAFFLFHLYPSLEQVQDDPRIAGLMRRAGFTLLREPPKINR